MKYCHNCGRELVDEAVFCPGCGVSQTNISENKAVTQSLKGGTVGFLLTLILGVIGLIFCLCLGNERCKKISKITFIVRIIAEIIINVVLFIISLYYA